MIFSSSSSAPETPTDDLQRFKSTCSRMVPCGPSHSSNGLQYAVISISVQPSPCIKDATSSPEFRFHVRWERLSAASQQGHWAQGIHQQNLTPVREGTRRYPTVPDSLITIRVPSSRIRSLSWYATVREGVSGDVSWYPKVRGGTRRHRVDACAILLRYVDRSRSTIPSKHILFFCSGVH